MKEWDFPLFYVDTVLFRKFMKESVCRRRKFKPS